MNLNKKKLLFSTCIFALSQLWEVETLYVSSLRWFSRVVLYNKRKGDDIQFFQTFDTVISFSVQVYYLITVSECDKLWIPLRFIRSLCHLFCSLSADTFSATARGLTWWISRLWCSQILFRVQDVLDWMVKINLRLCTFFFIRRLCTCPSLDFKSRS